MSRNIVNLPNWVGYKLKPKLENNSPLLKANGKPKMNKFPINPHTGKFAKTNDPSTWADFQTAINGMERFGYDGLGIVLTDEHWDAINFVKNFYDYHEDEELQIKDYNNAIKGKYAQQGGLKHLYSLFPEGPINTITQLAGIPEVKSTQNPSMGSVQ